MAYEFQAYRDDLPKALSVERLVQQLAEDGSYDIQPVNEREINIRFAHGQQRSSWPEDASVYLNDEGMLVAVHSGTEAQRTALIERLTDIYRRSGIDLSFDEV